MTKLGFVFVFWPDQGAGLNSGRAGKLAKYWRVPDIDPQPTWSPKTKKGRQWAKKASN